MTRREAEKLIENFEATTECEALIAELHYMVKEKEATALRTMEWAKGERTRATDFYIAQNKLADMREIRKVLDEVMLTMAKEKEA